jgi:hypothetical protein
VADDVLRNMLIILKKFVLIKFCPLYHLHFAYSKDKFRPRTGREGPKREERYSSTLSLPSALDGVGGQIHAPAASSRRETRYSLYRRLGGTQGPFWTGAENLA